MDLNVGVSCKKCGLEKTVKSGVVGGRQRFRCKGCGCNFRLGDNRSDEKIAAKKALCILWYAMGKGSYRMMGRILSVDHSLVYRWIRDFGKSLAEPKVPQDIKEIEFDEVWHFVGLKKNKLWVLKAIDRATRRTVAWVLGRRDTETFRRLYKKVKHLKNCAFYTDDWEAFCQSIAQKVPCYW